MKKIPLTQRQFAIVDDDDYEYLSQWEWHAQKDRNTYYARRNSEYKKGKRRVAIRMHRVLISAPDGMEVDHINGDGLDNRRVNLRVCTLTQNNHNRVRTNRNNTSGFANVVWSELHKKWQARIFRGKKIYLGHFQSKIEAAKAVLKYKQDEVYS